MGHQLSLMNLDHPRQGGPEASTAPSEPHHEVNCSSVLGVERFSVPCSPAGYVSAVWEILAVSIPFQL